MMKRWLLMICVLAFAAAGCVSHPLAQAKPERATVVWISIDGLRNDYIVRSHAPTLSKLMSEGAFTHDLTPIFPSLTFPNHIAQVTGTTVDHSGIPANAFYDTTTGQTYSFPDGGTLINSEPIWATAKRQGLRVAVWNWPMSQAQTGPWPADLCSPKYDNHETDAQRLGKLADFYQNDSAADPARLLMAYMSHVDSIGHKFGPNSDEVTKALLEADAAIDAFIQKITARFEQIRQPGDELYVLITTDHGMAPVRVLVNADRLIGAALMQNVKIVTSGPVANVYLNGLPAGERSTRADLIVQKLKSNDFLEVSTTGQMPADWHYADAHRVGDVVILLKSGYSFSSRRDAATQPVLTGPLGMHGYDANSCPEMHGSAILWKLGHGLGGTNVGKVDNTQWHALVAALLKITPSSSADQAPKSLLGVVEK